MITTVCFDVHGADALELQRRAVAQLAAFSGDELDMEAWTVDIDAHEEMTSGLGDVVTWRGEVTARRHDGPG